MIGHIERVILPLQQRGIVIHEKSNKNGEKI